MSTITTNLCNDLNRLAAINLISYGIDVYFGKPPDNFRDWKDGFLRDVGILMVYHQTLYVVSQYFKDSEMVDDFVKTSCLLLVPAVLSNQKPDWTTIGTVLSGVVIYHKAVRPLLMRKIGETFNTGIEDLVETSLLLAMTRPSGLTVRSALTQLGAIVIYHAYLRF